MQIDSLGGFDSGFVDMVSTWHPSHQINLQKKLVWRGGGEGVEEGRKRPRVCVASPFPAPSPAATLLLSVVLHWAPRRRKGEREVSRKI